MELRSLPGQLRKHRYLGYTFGNTVYHGGHIGELHDDSLFGGDRPANVAQDVRQLKQKPHTRGRSTPPEAMRQSLDQLSRPAWDIPFVCPVLLFYIRLGSTKRFTGNTSGKNIYRLRLCEWKLCTRGCLCNCWLQVQNPGWSDRAAYSNGCFNSLDAPQLVGHIGLLAMN